MRDGIKQQTKMINIWLLCLVYRIGNRIISKCRIMFCIITQFNNSKIHFYMTTNDKFAHMSCINLNIFPRSLAWQPRAPSARSSIRSWIWRCAIPLSSRFRWAPIRWHPRPAWRSTVFPARYTTASIVPPLMTTSTTARTQRWMDISILTKTNRQQSAHCFLNKITCTLIFQIHPKWEQLETFTSRPPEPSTSVVHGKNWRNFCSFALQHWLFQLFTYVVKFFCMCHFPSSYSPKFFVDDVDFIYVSYTVVLCNDERIGINKHSFTAQSNQQILER